MTCPICKRGSDAEHGEMACRWRYATWLAPQLNAPTAVVARDLTRMAHEGIPPEDDGQPSERLRLAWWVVRHAEFEWAGPWAVDLAFLARGSKRRARQYVDAYAYSAAQRDINRFAANRYALAALEALEPSP